MIFCVARVADELRVGSASLVVTQMHDIVRVGLHVVQKEVPAASAMAADARGLDLLGGVVDVGDSWHKVTMKIRNVIQLGGGRSLDTSRPGVVLAGKTVVVTFPIKKKEGDEK